MKTEIDWEEHVQLLFFVYRTAKHSITKLSPYEILFRQNSALLHFPAPPIDMKRGSLRISTATISHGQLASEEHVDWLVL